MAWQQQVNVGISGDLVGIELFRLPWDVPSAEGTGEFILFINIGSGWQTDVNEFESAVTLPDLNEWNYVDLSSVGLHFDVGDSFVIGVIGMDTNTGLGGSYANPELYTGKLYANSLNYQNWNIAFKTYVNPDSQVPEPTSLLLLGSGLGVIGLSALRRKSRS